MDAANDGALLGDADGLALGALLSSAVASVGAGGPELWGRSYGVRRRARAMRLEL